MGSVEDMAARLRAIEGDVSHEHLRSLPQDDQAFLKALASVLKLDLRPIVGDAIRSELAAMFGADPKADEKLAMLVAISQSLAQLDAEKIAWFVKSHEKSNRNFWGKDRDMLASVLDSAWTWHMVRPVLKWGALVGIGVYGLIDGGSITVWIKGMVGLL